MGMWIFGYASLVWRAGFNYDERIVGFIKGYRRAFHLACFEHRGSYELPARVATLEPEEGSNCWGVAFRVEDPDAAKKALAYLFERESEYDIIGRVQVYTEESPDKPVVAEALVFMSTLDKVTNKYYLGAAPKEDMAKQIATASGPNGPNFDYLFNLVDSLKDIGHEDKEVIELVDAVRRVMKEQKALASQANLGMSPRNMVVAQSLVAIPRPILPALVQGGPLNHSPKLLKSQAR